MQEQALSMDLRAGVRGIAEAENARVSMKIGVPRGTLSRELIASMASMFPAIQFELLGEDLRYIPTDLDIIFVTADGSAINEVEQVVRQCKGNPAAPLSVVILRNADFANTRILLQSGAVDVLAAPVGETALALCLERIVARGKPDRKAARPGGQLVALLKAGGGVGATSLGLQAALIVASRNAEPSRICFADLDLQFGSAAMYCDMADALTVTDCLAVGELLKDTQFTTALAAHKSGIRVLAAPREITPLDALTPELAEALFTALKRDFALTVADLPSVWTAWTYRTMQMAARIVLVTHLSVPHVHLVRRQLSLLAAQKLEMIPLTLVCNAVNGDNQGMLSIKEAERAIGRAFDIVIPDDPRVMGAACNQGLTIASVRRGTKMEKMVAALAEVMTGDALAAPRLLNER
jgi:pilus assembly protein CpaE